MKNLIIAVLWMSITMLMFNPVSADVYVQTKCVPNDIGFDVCQHAKDVEEEVSPLLPMQVTSNVTIIGISAFGPQLSLHTQIGYTKVEVVELLEQSDISYGELREEIFASTNEFVCSTPTLRDFVILGGEVSYAYTFSDNMVYLIIRVEEC